MTTKTNKTQIVERIAETLLRLPLTPHQRKLVKGSVGSAQEYQRWCSKRENWDSSLMNLADTLAIYREFAGRVASNGDMIDYWLDLAVEGTVAAVGRTAKDHIEAARIMSEATAYILA
jgi:hypothetical protein